MIDYEVLKPFLMAGERYEQGDVIELFAEEARDLLSSNHIKEVLNEV